MGKSSKKNDREGLSSGKNSNFLRFEKRKRILLRNFVGNVHLFSVSRRAEKKLNRFSNFEKRKRNMKKKILHLREEKEIFFLKISSFERRKRKFKKQILWSEKRNKKSF